MINIKSKCIDIEDENINCIVEYPVICTTENDLFINYVNNTINQDINIFKDIIKDNAICYNEKSTIFTDYKVHLNKKNILSIGIIFSELYNYDNIINYINTYNYDLNKKRQILIEDIFKKHFNYELLIQNEINTIPNKIIDEQSFYITPKYIAITFSSYEIANDKDIVEVKLYFKDIKEYLSDYTKKYIMEQKNETIKRI